MGLILVGSVIATGYLDSQRRKRENVPGALEASPPAAPLTPELQRGLKIYVEFSCEPCHGAGGKGAAFAGIGQHVVQQAVGPGVDQTEAVYVTEFGRSVRLIDAPGLHWKWPYQSRRGFDKRLQLDAPPPREMLTRDKKNLEVAWYASWRIADNASWAAPGVAHGRLIQEGGHGGAPSKPSKPGFEGATGARIRVDCARNQPVLTSLLQATPGCRGEVNAVFGLTANRIPPAG